MSQPLNKSIISHSHLLWKPLLSIHRAPSTLMPHATSLAVIWPIGAPATQLYPPTAALVNKHHGRSGSRAQQAQALSAVVKATERQESLCVTSKLPEGFQSGPLLCLPRCLPPFIFQSWLVVPGNATGLRLASRRLELTQRASLMPHCNITTLIKTYWGYMPFAGKSDRNE